MYPTGGKFQALFTDTEVHSLKSVKYFTGKENFKYYDFFFNTF